MRIALTGISGRLGRRAALRLARHHTVIGIDRRPCPGLPKEIEHHEVDIRRRPAENIFRQGNIDAVVHLGVVHNFRIASEQLYARNVSELLGELVKDGALSLDFSDEIVRAACVTHAGEVMNDTVKVGAAAGRPA